MVAPKEMVDDPNVPWEVLRYFPRQGQWGPETYLFVANHLSNHFIELEDGRLKVLEMPTQRHQDIALSFAASLRDFCKRTGAGKAVIAPYPVKVSESAYREPDVVFATAEHRDWLKDQFATGADLVLEVLRQDRNHDLVTKRAEYAAAGIREYWVIDPRDRRVSLLVLRDGAYAIHAEAVGTGPITSCLIPGFTIDVAELFSAD